MYKKFYPKFELLPNESTDLKEALRYYKLKLKENLILCNSIQKAKYEIPDFIIKKGCNHSAMIRNLEIRIKSQEKKNFESLFL